MLQAPIPPVKAPCPQSAPQSIASWKQRWLWGQCTPTCGKDQRTIWLLFGLPALLIWLTGTDATLAQLLDHASSTPFTGSAFTRLMREFGALPAALLAFASLIAMFWPHLWRSRPTLYQTAAVMVLTTVLGVGLVNQIIVKNLADRPRPRESVLTESLYTQLDSFRGNSMPSGHAAMGFVLAAPFFPLRRSRPRLAAAFFATGIVAGTTIGLSRMLLGAHFATDVLIAAAITFSIAALLTHFLAKHPRIPHKLFALGTLVCAFSVILGNRFSNLQLTLPLPQPFRQISLPCTPIALPTPGTTTPTLHVVLHGFGAPLSNLKLHENQGNISLRHNLGLYHHLGCTAVLAVPPTE